MSKYYSTNVAFGASSVKTEQIAVSTTKVGTVTTEASSGALTVDEVPTLDSLNPVSSDGVARAVIQAGAELPTRSSSDTGKVLTVKNSDGDLEWADGSTVTVDQTYNASSANAQSGVAVAEALSTKQDTISDLDTIRSGAEAGATAVQPSSLATVATTGSYTDLSNTPSIPAAQVNSDWNAASGVSQILNKPSLATVATSGSYTDLQDKPSIPAAQVNSDWNASSGVAQILNKPTIPDAQVNADWNSSSGVSEILNKPSLAAVATSGSYNDLEDKPTIPSAYSAGTGIDITSNVISADIDNSTIKTALAPSAIQEARNLIQLSSGYGVFEINSSVKSKLTQSSSASGSKLQIHVPGNFFSFSGNVTEGADSGVYVELCSDQYFNAGSTTAVFPVSLTNTFNSQTQKTYIDEQDVEISCYMADWLSGGGGSPLVPTSLNPAASSSSSHWYMGFFRGDGTHTSNQVYAASSGSLPPTYPVVISEYVAGNKICVNLPALTTAGISDIQLVNALPASPVSSVLYLIAET